MVWDSWGFKDLEEKNHSISELVNDGGVCRTGYTRSVIYILWEPYHIFTPSHLRDLTDFYGRNFIPSL